MKISYTILEELVQERAKFKAVANQLDLTYHELHGC